jgi:hypothetical protein
MGNNDIVAHFFIELICSIWVGNGVTIQYQLKTELMVNQSKKVGSFII